MLLKNLLILLVRDRELDFLANHHAMATLGIVESI